MGVRVREVYIYIYGRVRLDNVICLQRENVTKSLCVLQTGNHNTHSTDKVRTFFSDGPHNFNGGLRHDFKVEAGIWFR